MFGEALIKRLFSPGNDPSMQAITAQNGQNYAQSEKPDTVDAMMRTALALVIHVIQVTAR